MQCPVGNSAAGHPLGEVEVVKSAELMMALGADSL